MSTTAAGAPASCTAPSAAAPGPPLEAPAAALLEVVQRYGTPTYAYDLGRLRSQLARLRAHLPPAVRILYSLKANASLGLCGWFAANELGADVASAGELATAREAGFPLDRIFLSGPDKSPAVLAELQSAPGAVVSLDSVSELQALAASGLTHRALLRLRPDFRSFATCSAGPDSRFGLTFEDLPHCRDDLARVFGFHIFAGSQVLDAAAVVHHLRSAGELALRAAVALGVSLEILDLGGGFGVPYGPAERELDLGPVAAELRALLERTAPAQLVVELGRFLVAPAGWYLTTVLGRQTHKGRPAVVVDGGSHQRADLCGVGLRHKAFSPTALPPRDLPLTATDVLGCLSLPADVLAEPALLPPLEVGDVLAFPNAGAYGLGAAAHSFHAHPAPAEVAFDGALLDLLRGRQSVRSVLDGQRRLSPDANQL
jgi:diaminopimelate decarboxylase